MNDDLDSTETAPELPQAVVGRKRRFSLVWLIPIVAAVAGA
jgi:paraquat-inducible protein B